MITRFMSPIARSQWGVIAMMTVMAIPFAIPVWAHHSAAAMDFGNTVEIEGVVKVIHVINPHTKWILEVTDEKGTRDIEFEGHSRNNVYRAGYRDGIIKIGERVKVTVAPMRDGSDGGYVTGFETTSGQRIGLAQ